MLASHPGWALSSIFKQPLQAADPTKSNREQHLSIKSKETIFFFIRLICQENKLELFEKMSYSCDSMNIRQSIPIISYLSELDGPDYDVSHEVLLVVYPVTSNITSDIFLCLSSRVLHIYLTNQLLECRSIDTVAKLDLP